MVVLEYHHLYSATVKHVTAEASIRPPLSRETGPAYALGVNVLAVWFDELKTKMTIAANKWRRTLFLSSADEIQHAYRSWLVAEAAMAATDDPDIRDAILMAQWLPAHRSLCTLPVRTKLDLNIKIQVLLSEHENGSSAYSDALRQTIRDALAFDMLGT
ncbi:MAG: hypothetical protein LDL39_10510 [Magnetospirillum sp.]|nr:hypothetical protein [Magnetospirillum sp.]